MNNDTKTTIIGICMAIGTALADFLAHNPMEGGATKQPTFWILLAVAALMGVKGYFTNKANTTTVEKTTKVEVTTPTP